MPPRRDCIVLPLSPPSKPAGILTPGRREERTLNEKKCSAFLKKKFEVLRCEEATNAIRRPASPYPLIKPFNAFVLWRAALLARPSAISACFKGRAILDEALMVHSVRYSRQLSMSIGRIPTIGKVARDERLRTRCCA
jgi:hypothetical protein